MVNLIMLGTGHAMVTKCYNTCFALDTGHGSILVDAGGGNGILTQMERAGMDWADVRALFITHAHTDHIIGCIWALRKINSLIKCGAYSGSFHIYGLAENLDYLTYSCKFLLNGALSEQIQFFPVCGEDCFKECGIAFEIIDIHSTKKSQLGFQAVIREQDKKASLVCFGDEPCHAANESYAKDADWLLSEAFCLKSEAELFHPYEKRHSTAYDAGELAARLNVKNLVLYQTEDSDLKNRARTYSEEARQNFSGNLFVPADLEIIRIL